MGFRDLDRAGIERLLAEERVVRIAFSDGDERYLVPVFYTWHLGALCGLTTPGRKTRMAARDAIVAFQVDSTTVTGPYAWSSVSGQGQWEVVASAAEFGPFALALREKLGDAPAWAQQLLNERFAKLGMVAWRIRPGAMAGRTHEDG